MDKWLREYQTRGYRIKIEELLEQSKQTRLLLDELRGVLNEVKAGKVENKKIQ